MHGEGVSMCMGGVSICVLERVCVSVQGEGCEHVCGRECVSV